jgi:putative mRNA 3-end processing factor
MISVGIQLSGSALQVRQSPYLCFITPMSLLMVNENGFYCPAGDFYIDPWRPVDLAIVTHAHSDHARIGSRHYITAETGKQLLQERLGPDAHIESLAFGRSVMRDGVKVSLHPAGHILGSAQVRVEHRGEVWVVSGDYKLETDPTCAPFEPMRCHTFVTESTFGLPIFRWQSQNEIFGAIHSWWQANQAVERSSVVFAYSLGKAQRLLAGLDASIGPIFAHGAVMRFLPLYETAGVKLPPVQHANAEVIRAAKGRALVIAPQSASASPWLRKFGEISTAFASGWMQIRGARRRRALDRGFVLSDHADWNGLLATIRATSAERVLVTHGYTPPMVRWLTENGYQAEPVATQFEGEDIAEDVVPKVK